MRFGIGQPVTRKEDVRFLTGRARYVADIDLARQAHAVFIFSSHAHARIRAIDKAAAEQIYRKPQHEYTRKLLASVPTLD